MRTARTGLLLAAALVANGALAAPLTLDEWFRGPRIQDVSLSPDGRYLAIVVIDGDSSYVAIKDRTSATPAKPVVAADPTQDIYAQACGWVSNTRLVCRFSGQTGKKGEGDWVNRLLALDADGGNQRRLLSTGPATGLGVTQRSTDNIYIASYRTDEPDTLLVRGRFPGADGYSVGKLNAINGNLRKLVKTSDITVYQSDGFGNVLMGGGVKRTNSSRKQVMYFGRATNDDNFKQLKRLVPYAEDPNSVFLPVISNSLAAHVILTHNGRGALFKVDLTDQKDPELVVWHEQRDVSGGIFGPRKELLGVTFQSSILGPEYLDKSAAAVDAALRKNFPSRWNWVDGVSDDGKVYLIRTSSYGETQAFHVLDMRQGGVKFESIGANWPGLAKQALPVTEAVGIPMRNGGMREALFTAPADGAKKAPLVVFADGVQLTGGFEPATHFLATRGYAVLRSYFRGTEQDADWWHRPYQDWNGAQFDELLDATKWAAQRADVDPQRICIVGRGAYGGYQALLAAARADSPFKCVASFNGLSDLAKPRRDVAVANSIGEFKPQGPSDELVLRESPLKRAAEFRVPALLVEDDTVTHGVSAHESGREMAAALAAANKPHQLLLIDEVDDAYLRIEYAELVKFLDASLR